MLFSRFKHSPIRRPAHRRWSTVCCRRSRISPSVRNVSSSPWPVSCRRCSASPLCTCPFPDLNASIAVFFRVILSVYTRSLRITRTDVVGDRFSNTFKNVQPFVSGGQLERQGGMVRLQNAYVVVQDGQIVLRVAQKGADEKQHQKRVSLR